MLFISIFYVKQKLKIWFNFFFNCTKKAFGVCAFSNFDEDYEDDETYYEDSGFVDTTDDVSEFCDTVTGYSDIDGRNSQILGGGYYNQVGDGSVMTGFKSNAFLAN